MTTPVSKKTLFGATMLIAGCCVGAGMIGLPVASAHAGFMPSVGAMLFCYLFTTITGLFIAEATLWFDKKVNMPSIVEYALGKTGKNITITLFLFLFYCLFVAYLDAGGSLFAELLHISHSVGVIACMLFIGSIAFAGTVIVDGFNRSMLVAMIASYLILVAIGLPHVTSHNLLYSNWNSTFNVIPILLICFGFQNLVPSIAYYLNKNVNAIRFAIIVGNFIPLLVYFLWDYVILGMLSPDNISNDAQAEMVVQLLQDAAIPSLSVIFFVKSFSIFAMLTSFLPSAVSFADFLKDGFNQFLHDKKRHDFLIYSFVLLPPTICALYYPKIFLSALSFAGGFIDVLLYGVLPASVILIGRRAVTDRPYQVIGGSITPVVILVLAFAVLIFKLSLLM